MIRVIPQARWDLFRDRLMERFLAKAEEHGGAFPESERPQVLARLGEFADRVRALDEVEFLVQADTLAEEAEFLCREDQLEAEIEARIGPEEILRHKARANLLDPRAVAILEIRLSQLRTFEAEPVNLERGPIAPSCRDGRCAIDGGAR